MEVLHLLIAPAYHRAIVERHDPMQSLWIVIKDQRQKSAWSVSRTQVANPLYSE
jgi:hypothetical protein